MNWSAILDGMLALASVSLAIKASSTFPALRLGSWVLGCASALGTLRFSGLWPQPSLHQFFSMLGAGVGLPLLALTLSKPESAVARQRRFSWIFAVGMSVACILITLVAHIKIWSSACAMFSAMAIVVMALKRKDSKAGMAGLFMLFALLAFAGKLQTETLRPGDFLHIGLSVSLLTMWLWCTQSQNPNSQTVVE